MLATGESSGISLISDKTEIAEEGRADKSKSRVEVRALYPCFRGWSGYNPIGMNLQLRKKRAMALLLGLASAALAVFLLLCWLAAQRLIGPSRRALQDYHEEILRHSADHGLEVRPFVMETGAWKGTPCLLCVPSSRPGRVEKGNKLRIQLQSEGRTLLPWGQTVGTLVLLHGHTGRKEDHLPVAERLCAAGFGCLLLDLPGHGDHPDRFASFGVREVGLPAAALAEAANRFAFDPQPAGLFGISQGGAIALQAAAADRDAWFAVAELSAFADLDAVIANQAQRWFGPLHTPAQELVRWLVEKRAGYDPSRVRPEDAAAKLDAMPVLIGHGDEDRFVPSDHAKQIYDAVPSPRKQFLTITGAGHHTVLITPQPVYATLAKFFLDALPAR